jgi:hypothetical protein
VTYPVLTNGMYDFRRSSSCGPDDIALLPQRKASTISLLSDTFHQLHHETSEVSSQPGSTDEQTLTAASALSTPCVSETSANVPSAVYVALQERIASYLRPPQYLTPLLPTMHVQGNWK